MNEYGRLLKGAEEDIDEAYKAFSDQPVDVDYCGNDGADNAAGSQPGHWQCTVKRPTSVTGPGTFFGKSERTLYIEPGYDGWWFDRRDLPDLLPTKAAVHNVWTTGAVVRNIVLRSWPPENYIRMVEHMVALRLGLGIDNLVMRLDSGDPPLFANGSMELVKAIEEAGIAQQNRPVVYVTVKEPVSIVEPDGSFLLIRPCEGTPRLTVDCALDFNNAIGKQRVRFPLTPAFFRKGAQARTNTTAGKRLYCRTIGKIFADIRNLGYTEENVLIAGRSKYANEPRLMHGNKSLEAVWHRALLDLMAAFALIDGGRFCGHIISYKAGHRLDVKLITQLILNDLLIVANPSGNGGNGDDARGKRFASGLAAPGGYRFPKKDGTA